MKEQLTTNQELTQGQQLSPLQVQFVRLLEMSGAEIADEVRAKIEDNPALEISDDPDSADMAQSDDLADDTGAELTDAHPQDVDPEDDPADYMPYQRRGSADDYFTPQYADDSQSLYDYLTEQLGQLDLPDLEYRIGCYIIGNIDDNGYLTRSLSAIADDIAINQGVEVDLDTVRAAFRAVRTLDPAGVCAVDLRDCLLLQLKRITPATLTLKTAIEIIDANYDLYTKKHYDRLKAQLGVSDSQVLHDALNLISRLNPKPGAAVSDTASDTRQAHITPDVSVEVSDDGRFVISLINPLPALQVSESFAIADNAQPERRADRNRDDFTFIKSKRDEAETFINALKQRSGTLIAVTSAIARLQKDFFLTSDTARLRPMILKDVAELTGYDISVISRATMNKYVATDSGTYPLKMFFNEAPNDNPDTSRPLILSLIKDIVDNEDHRHPLSDDAICAFLAEKGHNIARRTIAKYRDSLGIPVARLRKKIQS